MFSLINENHILWKSAGMNNFSPPSPYILLFRMMKTVAYVEIFSTNLKEEKDQRNVVF